MADPPGRPALMRELPDTRAMEMKPESSPVWTRRDSLFLTLLVVATTLIRIPHLMGPYLINNDAIRYVERAQVIAQSGVWKGFSRGHPSLYPVLIALFHPLVGDWELAARLVSAIFGALTVIPLFLLAREVLGPARAWLPCLFYCVSNSVLFTSLDILRDPIFWFFFALCIWALVKAVRCGRRRFHVIAGLAALLSTTGRVDGLILFPVAALFLLFQGIHRKNTLRGLPGIACLLLPAILAGLIIFAVVPASRTRLLSRDIRGQMARVERALFQSSAVHEAVEEAVLEVQHPKARLLFSMAWEERQIVFLWKLLEEWVAALHPIFFALMLLGFSQRALWRDPVWLLFASLMAVWLIIGYAYLSAVFGFNSRYLIPMAMLGHLFAAEGFTLAGEALRRRWPRVHPSLVTGIMVVAVIVVILPKDLRIARQEKMLRREAGEWIRGLGISNPAILSNRPHVAFYAGGRWVPVGKYLAKPAAHTDLLVWVGKKGEAPQAQVVNALRATGRVPALVREFETSRESVRIYRLERTAVEEGD